MKLKNFLQRFMVIVAVILLLVCFVTGVPLEPDSPSPESLLWMITLMICIGTFLFPLSEKEKPLDWVLVGSFLGTCICLCMLLGLSDKVFFPGLFFALYLMEFLLSAGYRIGRRFGILDGKRQFRP